MKTVSNSIINNTCSPFHISLLFVSSRMRDARDLHDDGGRLPITEYVRTHSKSGDGIYIYEELSHLLCA